MTGKWTEFGPVRDTLRNKSRWMMKLCSFTLCQYGCLLQINIRFEISQNIQATNPRFLCVILMHCFDMNYVSIAKEAIAKRVGRSMVASEVSIDKQCVARILLAKQGLGWPCTLN